MTFYELVAVPIWKRGVDNNKKAVGLLQEATQTEKHDFYT